MVTVLDFVACVSSDYAGRRCLSGLVECDCSVVEVGSWETVVGG